MSLQPDYFVVSTHYPELYEVLKRIFDGSMNSIEVISGDINSLRKKNNKTV